MTREEVFQQLEFERKWLSDVGYNAYNVDIAFDSIKRVIKALDKESILDKIRAEIEQYLFQNEFGSEYRKEVSQIIDKYRESDGKE